MMVSACGGGGGGSKGSATGGNPSVPSAAPTAALSATSLSFVAQNPLSSSAAQAVTLTNSGNASLVISSIAATGAFRESNNCPASLAAGSACTVQITFNPVTAGSANGSLQISDNASVGSQSVALSGTGSSTVLLYVATNGSDSWSGTLDAPNQGVTDGPFATLDHARSAIQALDKTGLTQIAVQVRAGTYYLPATVQFTGADSGTASVPIVYQNYPGESPVFSGGSRVTGWTNTGGNTWTVTLPAATQVFESLFYNGARRLRPRINGYLGGTPYLRSHTYYAPTQSNNCSIQVTALLPGNSWECFDRFTYTSADPLSSTWKNLKPAAGNPCGQPAGSGAPAGDVELLDFEQFSTTIMRVACVDTTNHIVYLTGPTAMPANHYTEVGYIEGHRYIVENVQDALMLPGQWFLDRSVSPMNLSYLANAGENPNTDTVIVPQLTQLIIASNLQYVDFEGLTFEHDRFVVPAAGYTSGELEPNWTSALSFQNSQHLLFDGIKVTQTSGNGIEIIACTSANSPTWCVSTSRTAVTSNVTIQNSAFYDIGVAGIRIGEPGTAADNDANVPQSIVVQNNVVSGYGRTLPSAFGIGQGLGHDNLISHNDVFDGYHCAISVTENLAQSPTGHGSFNNTVSFNHVHDLLQGIMNDGGAIRIEDGNQFHVATGNRVLNNRIHDVSDASIMDSDGYGGHGIYLDNDSGLVDVENNLVYRVSDATIYTPHGPQFSASASTVKNNIFAFARLAMVRNGTPFDPTVPAQPNQEFVLSNNIFLFDRTTASTSPYLTTTQNGPFHVQSGCMYSVGFPATPYTQFQSYASNLYWRLDGGFASDTKGFEIQTTAATNSNNAPCGQDTSLRTFYTFAQWQAAPVNEDATSVVKSPGFTTSALYPTDDYSLPSGSPGVGFTLFDTTAAGRTSAAFVPPPIPATFATQVYSAATDF
jgi:centrosomal CEP192-like protein